MEQQVRPNVQTFTSAEFGELRTQVGDDGKIFFCLTDVARALDIANSVQLAQRLKSRGICSIYTPTKNQHEAEVMQQMTFIDEPNLYRCIFQSRKKEAEVFQSWVFEDLLPTIRKTGGYIATAEQDTPEMIMAKALQVAAETIKKHQEKLEAKTAELAEKEEVIGVLAPKAEYTEKVLHSESTLNVNSIAAELGVTAQCLNAALASMGVQYKQGNQWLLCSQFRGLGYTKTKTYMYSENSSSVSTVWTQKGRAFILYLTRRSREGMEYRRAIKNAIKHVEQLYEYISEDTPAHPDLLV